MIEDEAKIEVGACVFTAARIVKRDGDEVLASFRTQDCDGIEVLQRGASTNPLREVFWGIAFIVGGISVVLDAPTVVTKGIGLLLVAVGVWVLVHLRKRVTCARLYRASGNVDVELGVASSREERIEWNRRLASELGYRVPGRARE